KSGMQTVIKKGAFQTQFIAFTFYRIQQAVIAVTSVLRLKNLSIAGVQAVLTGKVVQGADIRHKGTAVTEIFGSTVPDTFTIPAGNPAAEDKFQLLSRR